MKYRVHCILVALSAFVACTPTDQQTDIPDRPYEPWVVRSVLDTQPRMLTLALSDNLWAAYSTQNCALYKVWRGYVDFEGAVYTTAHGPQPVTVGDAYMVNAFNLPWIVLSGQQELPAVARYTGHRIHEGHVELMYRITAKDLPAIRISEAVEYVESTSGQPGLERVFTTSSLPENTQVALRMNFNSIVSKHNLETDGELVVYEEESIAHGQMQLLELEGHLVLNSDATTTITTTFVNTPAIRNPNRIDEAVDEELPLGYRLIARSDCKTCHNTNVKTIGPAYVEVAQRYPLSEENVTTLARKVINGGAGIWGIQVMSAHPDLSETDARAMVEYILSLNPENKGEDEQVTTVRSDIKPDTSIHADQMIPGLFTEIFKVPENLAGVPDKPGYKPIMAGVMHAYDNVLDADFRDLSDHFALYASGYLFVQDSGTYVIRIWSDDGSLLRMNDQLLVDNDGSHGIASQQVTVKLARGYYSINLDFWQATGGKFLSLNWRKPGDTEFEVIPKEALSHHPSDHRAIAGLVLPMSVVSSVPGDARSLEAVHPSYDLHLARPYDFLPKVGGMDFLSDGRLVICTWDPTGSVYIISNPDANDPGDITVTRIAQGLAEPLGLKVVDDEIYVLQKQELTKLVDTDGDGLTDEYQCISNRWRTSANFHEFAFGLEYKDGYFYATLATAIEPGGASTHPQIPDRGKVVKIASDDGSVEFIAQGLRTPNGIGFGVDDELFVADNQGDWLPSSKIVHVIPGAWYGSRSVDYEGTAGLIATAPVVWLPQDEIGNSPSTPGLLEDGPYAGQMMHGEVTHGGLKRVFVEKVDGKYQGVVFRFIQGLEAGVNRLTKSPDGSIYIGGIGNPGNWAQAGKLWYGLQRLTYNSEPTFEMLAVRAKSDGVEIEFTEPLREGDGWNTGDYDIQQWQYIPTEEYGGPKEHLEHLSVLSANVSDDRTRVFLELDGMKEDRVVYVHLLNRYISAADREMWSTEAWYTMNHIPADAPGTKTSPAMDYGPNVLTREEKTEGWKLLFDGKTFDGWRRYRKDAVGNSWIVENGAIKLNARRDDQGNWVVDDRGDLMTEAQYEDFELAFEWKLSACGNSGLMFSVIEDDKYAEAYYTGPEMQILDNSCHPDARFVTHRAGDLYDMIESRYEPVKPAGQWNQVRLIKKDGKVEHWLNGVRIVQYEMYTDAWNAMIANSKFKDWEDFGQARKGHLVLQDHGDAQVWFRNIKLLELSTEL